MLAKIDTQETAPTLRPAWPNLWGADEKGAYLIAGRCAQCGAAALGIRAICPRCFATDSMTEERVGRRGTLYTATTIHQTPSGFDAPYRVGYVDIEHGLRMFAHVAEGPGFGDEVVLTLDPVRKDSSGGPLEGPVYQAAGGR